MLSKFEALLTEFRLVSKRTKAIVLIFGVFIFKIFNSYKLFFHAWITVNFMPWESPHWKITCLHECRILLGQLGALILFQQPQPTRSSRV
jgi:hypothetical protein